MGDNANIYVAPSLYNTGTWKSSLHSTYMEKANPLNQERHKNVREANDDETASVPSAQSPEGRRGISLMYAVRTSGRYTGGLRRSLVLVGIAAVMCALIVSFFTKGLAQGSRLWLPSKEPYAPLTQLQEPPLGPDAPVKGPQVPVTEPEVESEQLKVPPPTPDATSKDLEMPLTDPYTTARHTGDHDREGPSTDDQKRPPPEDVHPSFVPSFAALYDIFLNEFEGDPSNARGSAIEDGFLGGYPNIISEFETFVETCSNSPFMKIVPKDNDERRQRDWLMYKMHMGTLAKAEATVSTELSTLAMGGDSEKRLAIYESLLDIYKLRLEAATNWKNYHEQCGGIHANTEDVSKLLQAQEVYYAKMVDKQEEIIEKAKETSSAPKTKKASRKPSLRAQGFKGEPKQVYRDAVKELAPEDGWMIYLVL
ncbi:hypothetical protein cyc_00641 [Cyclospora cayetanensis]|nr:hypothetical protein cyc_00641 [Cyclospora cayetanensis]